MATKKQAVHTGQKAVDRVLPTHELRARQQRKHAVRLKPETTPENPRSEAAARKATEPGKLENFFSQFPPQTLAE